jgi:cysteinyl-tRNA synthetase
MSVAPSQESDLHDDSVKKFIASMNDDLNTPEALSILFGLAKSINSSQDAQDQSLYASTMRELGKVLGLLNDSSEAFLQYGSNLTDEEINQKIEERNLARDNKDFLKADQIRDELSAQGILLDDAIDGTSWKKS